MSKKIDVNEFLDHSIKSYSKIHNTFYNLNEFHSSPHLNEEKKINWNDFLFLTEQHRCVILSNNRYDQNYVQHIYSASINGIFCYDYYYSKSYMFFIIIVLNNA